MDKLQQYFNLKQLEEDQERQINQQIAMELYNQSQVDQDVREERPLHFKAISEYQKIFGYNPFDDEYKNLDMIKQIEVLNQVKYERIIESCREIDQILLELLIQQSRCQTISETEEDEEKEIEQQNFNRDIDYQQEEYLEQLKNMKSNLSNFTQQQQTMGRYQQPQNQKYFQSSAKNSNEIDQQLENQYNQFEQDDIDYVPKFGSQDSINFKNQLRQQLDFYQNELRISLSNRDNYRSLESQQSQQFGQSPDISNKYNFQHQKEQQQQKQKINRMSSENVFKQIHIQSKSESNLQQYISSPPITIESPQKLQGTYNKQKQKKQEMQKTSLLGSLFTPQILKDMQRLNESLKSSPTQIDNPLQNQEINVQQAFQIKDQHQQSQQLTTTNILFQSYSPLRIQILESISRILDENQAELMQQLQESGSTTLNLSHQQLVSKMPQIFNFIIQIAKEMQGKGVLTKATQLKINEQYKELEHILMKRNPAVMPKINANQIVMHMYDKVSQFLVPNYFKQTFKQSEYANDNQFIIILSPLISMLAIIDQNFPLINKKIPTIDWKLIEKILYKDQHIHLQLRQIPKQLLQVKIQEILFKQYRDAFQSLESLVNSPQSQELIKNNEFYNLIRLCYAINQCLEFMENLVFIGQYKLSLNNNEKYQENWNKQGTRYTSKKKKEDLQQQLNQEQFEKYGIDFQTWQLNLQIQENELKKIKKLENENYWKEKRLEKNIQKQILQKENQDRLIENELQLKLRQEIKEQQKQKEQMEFRERQQLKCNSYKLAKQDVSCREFTKKSTQNIELNSDLNSPEIQTQQNSSKIQSKLSKNKSNKNIKSSQIEDEERVWQRAQELLAKQKSLLAEKEKILKQMNCYK